MLLEDAWDEARTQTLAAQRQGIMVGQVYVRRGDFVVCRMWEWDRNSVAFGLSDMEAGSRAMRYLREVDGL